MYLVIDTETTNSQIVDDKLDLSNSLVYDLGYAIVDDKGQVYLTRSFVIADIFLDDELMSSAYFKDKIPQYKEDIVNGKRTLVSFYTARKQFLEDYYNYNCSIVSAHNSHFDIMALNNTVRYLTKSKYRYFFHYSMFIVDTLKMAKATICKEKEYIKFCTNNNYLTNHKTPRPKATAEILYRYLTNNTEFIESHTGLEDVLIEKEILKICLKMLDTNLFEWYNQGTKDKEV